MPLLLQVELSLALLLVVWLLSLSKGWLPLLVVSKPLRERGVLLLAKGWTPLVVVLKLLWKRDVPGGVRGWGVGVGC